MIINIKLITSHSFQVDIASLTQKESSFSFFVPSFVSRFYAHPFLRLVFWPRYLVYLYLSPIISAYLMQKSPAQTNSDPSVLSCHSSLVQLFLPLAPPPEVPLSCPRSPLRMDDLLKPFKLLSFCKTLTDLMNLIVLGN